MSTENFAAKQAIHKARTRLLSSHPFYGFICCKLKLREVMDLPASFATDGEHLFYQPDEVMKLSKTKLVGRIAHEGEHCYLDHMNRMEALIGCKDKHHADKVDPHDCYLQVAQVAADYAINPHLKDAGFDIDDGVFPDQKYWSDSLEAHYKRMKKSAKKVSMPANGGCAGVQPPKGKDGKALSQAEIKARQDEMQTTILQAAAFARAAGKLPADLERLIGDLRAPKISWTDVLRRFMHAISKNDYRMWPPNRRYIHQGLYLPSLRSETVGDILIIMDGSGSTRSVFPQFVSEVASVLQDVRPEHTHVTVWDTRCAWYKEFDNFTEDSIQNDKNQFGAGGGSDFRDCFKHFERETGIRPSVAIILTDMEIYWPEEDPGYPTLWVATTDEIAPFGETVKIDVEV